MKKWNQKWTMPARVLLAGAGIAAAAMLVPLAVSALAPPANTSIGNQAFADYKDFTGTQLRVKSNEVITTVAQVGGVFLSNNGDKTAAAANTVAMPHTLTNTGNGPDSFKITAVDVASPGNFSIIAIYADNGNGGQTGPALCETPVIAGTPSCAAGAGFTQSVNGNNGTFNFVVAYTIPNNATTPLAPAAYDTAVVTATPVASTIVYPTTLATDDTKTDTVRLTIGAAFASTKTIGAPAVAAPLGGAWPTAVSSGNASPATGCTTQWSATLGSNPPAGCTYTVYTINYNNAGGATGSFSMSDILGAVGTANVGLTYVNGSAVWSGAGGTAMSENGGSVGAGLNVATSTYAAATGKFSAVVSNVEPNHSGTISFVVLVNSLAVAGKSKSTNTALYGTTDCTGASCTITETNGSWFTVLSIYKVIAANFSGATTFDSTPGAPLQTKPGVDVVEPIGTTGGNSGTSIAYLGSKVYFTDYVINKSNVSDTFNVTIPLAAGGTTGNNTFPVGTTFAFYTTSDGINPSGLLLDTNKDSIFDTGLIDPNAWVAIIVEATLPSTGTVSTVPVYALMTATSVGAGASTPVIDAVWNEIDAVKSGKVDLTNSPLGNVTDLNGTPGTCSDLGQNCDLGQGPTRNPTFTESTTPGVPVSFPIYIKNQDTVAATYNLTYPNIPSGWTVKFVSSTGTCASTAVSQPVSVGTGIQLEVLACVTPLATALPGITNVQFAATSTTDATVKDVITDAVQVNAAVVPNMSVSPITSTVTTPDGGSVVIPVTLSNTGNTSCGLNGGFNVSVALDAASKAAGWNYAVYYDGGIPVGAIDIGDTLIDVTLSTANLTTALDPGALIPLAPAPGNVLGIPLLVKLIAPKGATIGSIVTATLTVKDMNSTLTAACPNAVGIYYDTVTNGQLSVQKTQQVLARVAVTPATIPVTYKCDGTTAVLANFDTKSLKVNPGDCIAYQVVSTNMGNANVTSVMLNDNIPAYTLFNATQPGIQCAATLNTGVPLFIQSGSGTATTAVACGLAGGSGVTLQPNGTMTLFYVVEVQQ